MDKRIQTTRNSEDTMQGKLSVTFSGNDHLPAFCKKIFSDFDPLRYDIVAVRLYFSGETIFTLYAHDKTETPDYTSGEVTLRVKKFKAVNPSFPLLMDIIREFNFTLTNGNYPLEEIEVTNK